MRGVFFSLQVNPYHTDPNANKEIQFSTPVSSKLYKPVTFSYKNMQSSSLLSKFPFSQYTKKALLKLKDTTETTKAMNQSRRRK